MTPGSAHHRRAFTLLEMAISTGLVVMLMSMMFWFYRSSLEQRTAGSATSRNVQLARVILERMTREIRQAVASLPGYGPGITGYKDRDVGSVLAVNTLTVPDRKLSEVRGIRDAQLPGQFDLQRISYYIAWDYENVDTNGDPRALGLVRKVERTYLRDVVFAEEEEEELDAEAEAELATKRELYAPEIKFLEVLYFDGSSWWEEWELTQGNALPQIVRLTIGFVPELPEAEEFELVEDDFLKDEEELDPLPKDQYSVFVRLQQADVFFGSRLSREASAFSKSAGL